MHHKAATARRRSPFLCCDGVVGRTFIRTALLSAVLTLVAAFAVLVLVGALNRNSRSAFFFVSASILLSAAAVLALFYVWLKRKERLMQLQNPSKWPGKTSVSTVSGLDYYSQVPTGAKSDFPMGPYLVMTLPKTNHYRDRSGTMDSDSRSNTPRNTKKPLARRNKNLPPLASAETLTPSLLSSSYGSIDSVV